MALIIQNIVFKETVSMRFTVIKLPLICGIGKSQKTFSMPFAFQPLSLIKKGSFFDSHSSDLVLDPCSFVYSSIREVVDSLPTLFAFLHLPFIPLSIFLDIYPFAIVQISIPFSEVDISIAVLKDSCSRFLMIFELALVNLSRRIFDLFDVVHEFPVGIVDVLLEE